MDKKIMAVGIVAVILIAAVAVFFVTKEKDDGGDNPTVTDNDMSIIGRVNTDGSGIYFKAGENAADYVTKVNVEPTSGAYLGGNGTWIVFNPSAWGGKVIGDPGEATIQHVQLGEIAKVMGLKFVKYQIGTSLSNDTLYYLAGVGNYANFKSTLSTTPALLGAFNWEPQYSIAARDGCVAIATTNDMFPEHTCCIIGASHSYITNHSDETVRFLAAYIKSVDKMKAAIEAGSGADYDALIKVAKDKVSMPGLSDEQKEAAILDAFKLVNYTYADTTDKTVSDPLANLKKDIADLAVSFYPGQVGQSYSDLGFSSAEALAEKFVQSSYIKDAMNFESQASYSKASIKVAAISGDIHQLALHYGISEGIFDEYGLDVTVVSQANGPAVYTAIHAGEASLGFIGAPPMTINAMNAKEITPSN